MRPLFTRWLVRSVRQQSAPNLAPPWRPLFTCFFVAVAAALLPSRAAAQSFPFEDRFTTYTPGTNGAPAWSILSGGPWHLADGALQGPITIRFNAKMPRLFTVDAALVPPKGAAWDAAVSFSMQHEKDTVSSDEVRIQARENAAPEVTLAVSSPARQRALTGYTVAPSDAGAVSLRIAVDNEAGRYSVFANDHPVATAVPMEYAAGLLAIRLGDGTGLKSVRLRVPTTDEKRSLLWGTLFNDPRDLTRADGDRIFVLHRGSPAVLAVTPDGEITTTFGRRLAVGVPDPVAIERGMKGEVLVLNRTPGEVVVYDRTGGVRYRFGAGKLTEPWDFAVLPDGTIYVADPGAGRIVAFGADGQYLGPVAIPAEGHRRPWRLSLDATGNILVAFGETPPTVATLRPQLNRTQADIIDERPFGLSDAAVMEGKTLAAVDGTMMEWPTSGAPPANPVRVDSDARLSLIGSGVYALDRGDDGPFGPVISSDPAAPSRPGSRILRIPASLRETAPSVSFQNIAQTVALVRWTSDAPSADSQVRILRGNTWDMVRQHSSKASTEHQVQVERLEPGKTYRYSVSPLHTTIPPSEWSGEFTFATAPVPSATGGAAASGTGK